MFEKPVSSHCSEKKAVILVLKREKKTVHYRQKVCQNSGIVQCKKAISNLSILLIFLFRGNHLRQQKAVKQFILHVAWRQTQWLSEELSLIHTPKMNQKGPQAHKVENHLEPGKKLIFSLHAH